MRIAHGKCMNVFQLNFRGDFLVVMLCLSNSNSHAIQVYFIILTKDMVSKIQIRISIKNFCNKSVIMEW